MSGPRGDRSGPRHVATAQPGDALREAAILDRAFLRRGQRLAVTRDIVGPAGIRKASKGEHANVIGAVIDTPRVGVTSAVRPVQTVVA